MASNIVEYVLDIKTKAAEDGLGDVVDALEKVEKELKDTQKETKKTSTSMEKMKSAGMALAKVGAAVTAVAVAVGAAGAAAFGAAKKVTDLTNELNDLSVRSGVSAKTLQGLRQAMLSSGQPAEGLVEVLGAISGQFAQLSTEGSAVEKKFESFGIAVKDASGEVRSNNDILVDSIKLLQGISDSSERSRTAVLLFGEAGAKLNQALAAGDFEKFLSFTEKFGIQAGPEASKAAAQFQVAISGLGTVLNGTLQKFVNATKLQERFIKSLIELGSVLAFVGSLLDSFSSQIGRFVDSFLLDFKVLLDILGAFIDLVADLMPTMTGFSGAFEKASSDAQEFKDSMNAFANSMSGLESGLAGASSEMDNLGEKTNKAGKELQKASVQAKTFEQILMQILGSFGVSFIDFDQLLSDSKVFGQGVTKILKTNIGPVLDNIFIGTLKKTLNLTEKIKTQYDKLFSIVLSKGEVTFGSLTKLFENGQNRVLGKLTIALSNVLDTVGIKLNRLIERDFGKIGDKISSLMGNLGSKFGESLSAGISAGAAAAIGAVFAIFAVAKKLGQRARTEQELKQLQRQRREEGKPIKFTIEELQEKDIKKSIEEDIRATAKAIEIGLQVMPRILVETLPPLLIELADRVVFGILKGFAERVNILIEAIKSIFTREGRQERKAARDRRQEARSEEFMRRLQQLFGIAGFRAGGRYIPSARGGIKFTGMQEEGLALLHRGEFVVPETGQMPQAVQRTMGMGGGGITININASVVESNAVDELVRQIERRFQTFGSSTSPLFGGR